MNNNYRVYLANPTMKILGKQVFPSAEELPELLELEAAYCSEKNKRNFFARFAFANCFEIIADVFNLGVIIGIRKERQRRKTKSPANAPTLTGPKP